jgi:diguanylate cyclase (GGDEF)-like protein
MRKSAMPLAAEAVQPALLAELAAAAPVGLCAQDNRGHALFVNDQWRSLMGLSRRATQRGRSVIEWVAGSAPGDHGRELAIRYGALATGDAVELQLADGRSVLVQRTALATGGVLDTVRDTTDDRLALAAAACGAKSDSLTGLANRRELKERLKDALQSSTRGEINALIYLDLDDFKPVNDVHGHAVGDELLAELGERLKRKLRATDTAARMGGDEFAVLLRALPSQTEASTMAERIIAELAEPVHVEGRSLAVTCSAGIVLIDGTVQDPELVQRRADLALYVAKSDGKGRARHFDSALQDRQEERLTFERDLKRALARDDELQLFYQPKLDPETSEILALEALLRWNHPERGHLEPPAFIPLAEALGMMPLIDAKVLADACLAACAWPNHIRVSVNLSGQHFVAGDVVRAVQAALALSNLDPHRLELEVETGIVQRAAPDVIVTLRKVKALGVRITLDNFQLDPAIEHLIRDRVIDRVKINATPGAKNRDGVLRSGVVGALAGLCKVMGAEPDAGRVERHDYFNVVGALDCQLIQGHGICPPINPDELGLLLSGLGPELRGTA